MADVDLDRLARAYDHRPDFGATDRVRVACDVADLGHGDLVLDVGGGRGAHSAAFVAQTGCTAVVLDPSRAMGEIAARRGLPVVTAVGEDLPVPDGLAALVYFHLSIHHGDWRRMLEEAWRVVRPGGVVWVWTMDPEYHRRSQLSRWFPRVGEIDSGRFPPGKAVAGALSALGGTPTIAVVAEPVERRVGDWVAAVRAGFVSTLHLLSDEEIDDGLARFEAAHPDPDEVIRYSLEFTSVWSTRPPVES